MKSFLIVEWSKFWKVGDIVLIEYWYNSMVTPVKIIECTKNRYRISHDNQFSKIKNAPDEWIKSSDIISSFKR